MAVTLPRPTEPVTPNESDMKAALESSRLLGRVAQSGKGAVRVRVVDGDEQEATLSVPAIAVQLLLQILTEMGKGNAVTLVPHHAELTTQQAADMLSVSRPYLVKLLETGEIPFHKVGTHRRILFSDVLAYQQKTRAAREQALDELAALSQELGLYELED